jgi:Tfp pilus assembly protein PilE
MWIMRNTNSGFSIVEFLIIVALLLVAVGIFGPRVSKYMKKSKPDSSHAAVVLPVR